MHCRCLTIKHVWAWRSHANVCWPRCSYLPSSVDFTHRRKIWRRYLHRPSRRPSSARSNKSVRSRSLRMRDRGASAARPLTRFTADAGDSSAPQLQAVSCTHLSDILSVQRPRRHRFRIFRVLKKYSVAPPQTKKETIPDVPGIDSGGKWPLQI